MLPYRASSLQARRPSSSFSSLSTSQSFYTRSWLAVSRADSSWSSCSRAKGSVNDFHTNLSLLIKEIKQLGGYAIPITTIAKRLYVKGVITDGLGPFAESETRLLVTRWSMHHVADLPAAMVLSVTKQVANEQGFSNLDLYAASTKYWTAIKEPAARLLDYKKGDNTHLNPEGGLL